MFRNAWRGDDDLLSSWLLAVAVGSVGLSVVFVTSIGDDLDRGLPLDRVRNVTGGVLIGVGMVVALIRLNRAVAVGEADGAPAGLAALAGVDENVLRRDAVSAHLHERNGDLELAARLYASAARTAPRLAERDHQTCQAARLNHLLHHER